MAGIKISALPAIPLDMTTDFGPFVQSGVTYKATLAQIATLFNSTLQLASTAQVTGLNAALATFVPLAGGTMSGPLILSGDPTLPLGAVTKQYADAIAGGFTVILSCLGATTANLVTVYANGAAGVGATLTDNVGTFLPFAVDGLTPALGSRILVKDQTTTFQNGVYTLTTNGDSISIPYVLTRATDYDQAPSEVKPGTLIAVNTGTANANTSWLETATVNTMGTDPILFSQFTFAPSAFLLKANNLSDVASAATSRTNLGLGTVATKAASDAAKTNAVMLNAAPTIGHLAVFTDVNGTIGDGGIVPTGMATNDHADGRLTLTTGLPVTTSDVTAATTIFYTPQIGNSISLYNGATWDTISFTEISIAVPGTTSTMYDMFIFNNAGTAQLETQTWTNDTTRATTLVRQDGILVKNGTLTRRYVGSFRTGTVNGQTEDSVAKRYLWNYYNRSTRGMIRVDTTGSWNYSLAAYRQANANAANQLDFVIGVSEDIVTAVVRGLFISNVAANMTQGIGLDSTTVTSSTIHSVANVSAGGNADTSEANFSNYVAAGRHVLTWLEFGFGAGTQTFFGLIANFNQSGIFGSLRG